MTKKNQETYTGENIDILEGLQAIRVRPDMYVGGKDGAVFHIFKEVIDNAVDEYLNGYSTYINVELDTKLNKVRIEDNGRGIPVDIHPKEKIPTMQVLFTKMHSGGKFDKKSFKISGGKNGIGVKATNALSSYLKIFSVRDGYMYSMEFAEGKVVKELKKEKNTTKLKHGSIIEFIPDSKLMGDYSEFNIDEIRNNLELRTYCNAGLKAMLKVNKDTYEYYHENGMIDYLELKNKDPFSDVVYFDSTDDEGNSYEITFNYGNSANEHFESFVNGINTSKGVHETGFKMGLTSAFLDYIKKNKLLPKKYEGLDIKGEDVRHGIVCLINLKLMSPEYRGQTKDELSNPEVLGVVKKLSYDSISDYLNKYPNDAKKLINRIVMFANGRIEANRIKDKVINISNSSAGLSLSTNLTDCTSDDPAEREIFIVEGKSASGNIKNSRLPKTQAVFPLRGKPLNSYGLKNSSILANVEFRELIKIIFGTTDINNINYDNVRYHRINILSDADTDGQHIQSLLTLFLYTHFKPLLEMGYVYVGMPPKYRCLISGKYVYFKSDRDLYKYMTTHINKRYAINNKGLTINHILEYKDSFKIMYRNTIIHYTMSNNVLNTLIENDIKDASRIIKDEFNLDVEKDHVFGLYDNNWHDFYLSDELVDDINKLRRIFNIDMMSINDKKDKVDIECSLIDGIKILEDQFNYKLDYFKGLGEADPEELFDTTLDPETRDMIRLNVSDFEGTDDNMKILFGNNPETRKVFIKNNIMI